MITLYAADAEDLTTNGLQILDRLIIEGSAVMHEELNGEYSLEMDLLPEARVRPEMLIRAPAPARDTPAISETPYVGPQGSDIYTVNGGSVYMRSGPGMRYKAFAIYHLGDEMIMVDNTSSSSWSKITAPDGNTGWMFSSYLTYTRTIPVDEGGEDVIEPHKAKDQVFRVVEVIPTLEAVHVRALHWFYDLRRNYVASAAVKGQTGAGAIQLISAATAYEHDFVFYADVGGSVEDDLKGVNPAEALLGDGGLVEQLGGEVMRDNAEIYWTERIGQDRGVTIAYRKNMTGMEVDISTEEVATRIIPVGFDGNGDEILLSEVWVDSPILSDYPLPCIRRIEYRDVKVGDQYANAEAVRAELRRRAEAEYSENHLDKPELTLKVQYVDLKNTSVGRSFAHYTNVYMGDTVRVAHDEYGFMIEAEMTEYDWDPVLEEYIECTFTNKPARLGAIWND